MRKTSNPVTAWLFGTAPRSNSAPSLDGNVDYAILAVGYLILVGWYPNDATPKIMRIGAPKLQPIPLRPLHVRHVREDVTAQFESAGRTAPYQAGFVCGLRISAELELAVRQYIIDGTRLSVGVEFEIGIEQRFKVAPTTAAQALGAGDLTDAVLAMAIESVSAAGQSDPAVHFLANLIAKPGLQAHVDSAITHNSKRVLLSGWVENAQEGRVALVNADLGSAPLFLDPLVVPRADVTAHLRKLGRNPSTDMHGVVAVANLATAGLWHLCCLTREGVSWSPELQVSASSQPPQQVLGHLRRLTAESHVSGAFDRMAQMLIGADRQLEPTVAKIEKFMATDGFGAPVRVSIIVPFYGDAFYLRDHIMAQSRAPADVEWVLVCDDPKLAVSMTDGLSNSKRAIRQPTQLLVLSANGGFAHANNIGARHAQGDYLLLMNSDIYCEDYDFLNAGISALQTRADIGCVGFSLQFEDGTIQHDGMSFKRSPLLDRLWACEHSNKGMPQDWKGASLVTAEAVTAALLLVRRGDFAGADLFDPSYLIGDFEDADLCMRLRAQGKSIGLIRAPGMFHLERQSLRHSGDDDARMALTHLNCITFNNRWATQVQSLIGANH